MKAKITLSIGYPTVVQEAVVDIDPEAIKGKTPDEIQDYLHQVAWDHLIEYVEVYGELINGD